MSKNKTNGQICPQLSDLPFYNQDKPPVHWHIDKTGDYAQQCQRGMGYATATLHFINQHNFNPLLGWIVEDMITVGNFGGVEVGFFSTIAQKAVGNCFLDATLIKLQEQENEI